VRAEEFICCARLSFFRRRRSKRLQEPEKVAAGACGEENGVECAIIYVSTFSARVNRIAIPRGLALGPVSEICVITVDLEKRMVRGVDCRIDSTSK